MLVPGTISDANCHGDICLLNIVSYLEGVRLVFGGIKAVSGGVSGECQKNFGCSEQNKLLDLKFSDHTFS